ncbi:MAG: tetratricopeptide repeat protein [Planctomycetes bacterium]|nr:tetratricopeptide repeat protein [Planctomycetota bacterium]
MVARLVDLRLPRDESADVPHQLLNEAVRLAGAYAAAFSEYGLEVPIDAGAPTGGLERLAAEHQAIVPTLAAALDHWGIALRRLVVCEDPRVLDAERRERLLGQARQKHALAARLDPGDAWRDRLRATLAAEGSDPLALKELAESAPIETQPVLCALTLGEALSLDSEHDAAVAFLRRVQDAHPGDVVLALRLGRMLEEHGMPDEAFALYRIAHALRPEMIETRHRAGHALFAAGDLERAARLYDELAAEDPRYRWYHHAAVVRDNMDAGSIRRGAPAAHSEAAMRCFRAALDCEAEPWDPDKRSARYGLARVQIRVGEPDVAVDALREIIAEDPEYRGAHFALALALQTKTEKEGLPDGAEFLGHPLIEESLACYRRSLELDPDQIDAHYNIGNIYRSAGQLEEAIEEYRLELEHHHEHVGATNNLGRSLSTAGRIAESVEVYRRVVELAPNYGVGWSNLASALRRVGSDYESLQAAETAVRLDPRHANSRANLAFALWNVGRWSDSVTEWERAVELDPRSSYFREQLTWARAKLEASAVWDSLLRGRLAATEASIEDLAAAASLAYMRREYTRSARLWTAALQRDPEATLLQPLASYDAACAAVLAAAGAGEGAGALEERERTELRRAALEWLQRRLAAWRGDSDAAAVVSGLTHWLGDQDLASVRELASLGALPADEAQAWAELWGDVVSTIARARGD